MLLALGKEDKQEFLRKESEMVAELPASSWGLEISKNYK